MIITGTHRVAADPKHRRWSARARLVTGLLLATLVSSLALGDVWFLGIGNDGYYTDVSGLYDAYQTYGDAYHPGVPIHFLGYEDHGGPTILEDINWLAESAGPGDYALFFYSGHGGREFEWFGDEPDVLDETIGLLSGSQITDDQLADAFRRIDSRVPTIPMFDSCYSGGMVGGTADLNTLPNVYVMMSSEEGESSYGADPYSRFTAGLIDGIGLSLPADDNNDRVVTFDEWFHASSRPVCRSLPHSTCASSAGTIIGWSFSQAQGIARNDRGPR